MAEPGLAIRVASAIGIRDAGRVLRDFTYSYLPNQALAAVAGAIALPILAHELTPTYLGVLTILASTGAAPFLYTLF